MSAAHCDGRRVLGDETSVFLCASSLEVTEVAVAALLSVRIRQRNALRLRGWRSAVAVRGGGVCDRFAAHWMWKPTVSSHACSAQEF